MAAAAAARARRSAFLRVYRLLPGQRPGGLQARVESYALHRRHRRSPVASRRSARGARSEPPPPSRAVESKKAAVARARAANRRSRRNINFLADKTWELASSGGVIPKNFFD